MGGRAESVYDILRGPNMLMFALHMDLLLTIPDKQITNHLTFYNDALCIPPLFIHNSAQIKTVQCCLFDLGV